MIQDIICYGAGYTNIVFECPECGETFSEFNSGRESVRCDGCSEEFGLRLVSVDDLEQEGENDG